MPSFAEHERPFAIWYDSLYADKDYEADITAFTGFARRNHFNRLLEIGAGTGNHSRLLSRLSSHLDCFETDLDFCRVFRKKLTGMSNVTLHDRLIEDTPPACYDGACAFFYMLNYLTSVPALTSFLTAVSKRLAPDGRFVADIWHGDFFAKTPPENTPRRKSGPGWQAEIQTQTTIEPTTLRTHMVQAFHIVEGGATHSFEESYELAIWRRADIEAAAAAAGFSSTAFHAKAASAPGLEASPFLWFVATR